MKTKLKNVFKTSKNLLLFFVISLILTPSYAQLKVETNGRVKFGPGSLRVFSGSDDWGYINVGNTTTKGLRFTPSGKMYLFNSDPTSFVTATSSTTQRNLIVMDPSGNYKFWVLADGSIFSQSSYITSDSSKKENVTLIPNALDKVMKIRGLTYNLKKDDKLNKNNNLWEKPDSSLKVSSTQEVKKRSAGVFAQDVEKVLPEAVRTLEDGSKVVSYDNLVALLIEAVKEQQTQIDKLKSSSGAKLKSSENLSNSEGDIGASLFQNIPNPFNQETTIEFYLPSSITQANIYVYDLQGKQIKSININDRGQSSIIIYANELQAGIYKYALIADNQIVGTETMILTN